MKSVVFVLAGLCSVACLAQPKPFVLNFAENPPYTISQHDKHSGIAVAVVTHLFNKARIPFKLASVPMSRAMAEAKAQEMTCVFPMQRSQWTEADYAWVSPILVTESGLFVRPDFQGRLDALAQASRLTIGAVRGSGEVEYLRGLGYTVEEANTHEQSIKMLLSQRIDVWASDTLSARYFVRRMGVENTMPKEVLVFRRALGSLACNAKVPKNTITRLQQTLDTMMQDGSLFRITADAGR